MIQAMPKEVIRLFRCVLVAPVWLRQFGSGGVVMSIV
jgi:hypothetical protein